MTFISEAKCIWQCTGETGADRYISFFKDFSYTGSDEVTLTIAADSTYVVRINGTRCPISQLADRPGDYTFSTCDVTQWLRQGTNRIAVEVHFIGADFLTIFRGIPFLRAALCAGETILAATDETWSCRESREMISGRNERVSNQLGFTFVCDGRVSPDWITSGGEDWQKAVEVPGWKQWNFTLRRVPRLLESPGPDAALVHQGYLFREKEWETPALTCYHDYAHPFAPTLFYKAMDPSQNVDGYFRLKHKLKAENGFGFALNPLPDGAANGYYVVADLGRETVGFLSIQIEAPENTVVDICHGEHLTDGRVRAAVGGRNFSDRYICHEGMNTFTYCHRRAGGRYVELHITNTNGGAVTVYYAGMLPLDLPLPQKAEFDTEDRLLQKVNEVSIDTLRLCMHEHYEDCPWREQGLYAYDSRNQILYGYYVWGNYDFVRAALDLLGKSFDGERYLALTGNAKCGFTIPVFTLVWITEIYEYTLYSGDLSLYLKWKDPIDVILKRALAEPDTETKGLYHPGTREGIWSFCEWTGRLAGLKGTSQAPYNVYLCESLRNAVKLHELAGDAENIVTFRCAAEEIAAVAGRVFYNEAEGRYDALLPGALNEGYEHIQAIMLANELVTEEKLPSILANIQEKKLRNIDLSALYYLCSACMKSGPEFRKLLLPYVRSIMEPIVLSGATSLWETRTGEDDFDNAGSLCHAWSSVMPYLCGGFLLGVKPLTPGFRTFEVKPYDAGLTHASGEIPTPEGMIRITWAKGASGLRVTVEHPAALTPVPAEYPECPVESFEHKPY